MDARERLARKIATALVPAIVSIQNRELRREDIHEICEAIRGCLPRPRRVKRVKITGDMCPNCKRLRGCFSRLLLLISGEDETETPQDAVEILQAVRTEAMTAGFRAIVGAKPKTVQRVRAWARFDDDGKLHESHFDVGRLFVDLNHVPDYKPVTISYTKPKRKTR